MDPRISNAAIPPSPLVSLLAVLCITMNTFTGLQLAEAPAGSMTQDTSLFSGRLKRRMQANTSNTIFEARIMI